MLFKQITISNANFAKLNHLKDFDLISIEPPDPTIPRHKTAISRYSFSKPIKKLLEHNLITNITSVFDYGCGRGDDIRLLTLGGYKAKGWDPYFTPDNKKISSDVVNLGFVLNVIESEKERVRVLKDAFGLTKKGKIKTIKRNIKSDKCLMKIILTNI